MGGQLPLDTRRLSDEGAVLANIIHSKDEKALVAFLERFQSRHLQSELNEFGDQALHLATRENWAAGVRVLQPKIKAVGLNNEGQGPEHIAAILGNKSVLKLLLRSRDRFRSRDPCGRTWLHLAAENGRASTVSLFKSEKEFFKIRDARSKSDDTAMQLALANGHCDIVKTLVGSLRVGRDRLIAESGVYGRTTLMDACTLGNTEMVVFLCERGWDVHAIDDVGSGCLFRAALRHESNIIEVLLKHGLDPEFKDSQGRTQLHIASLDGEERTISMILEVARATVDSRDKEGRTSLHLVSQEGVHQAIKCLLEHGADINSETLNGQTPLHLASLEGKESIVECLLHYGEGINVNSGNSKGQTPLHLAVLRKHQRIIRCLVEYGADSNLPDHDGETPLNLVSQWGHERTKKHMLDYAKIREKTQGIQDKRFHPSRHTLSDNRLMMLLKKMIKDGSWMKIERLLKGRKFDCSVTDDSGETLLHFAARMPESANEIRVLLEKGAKVDARNHKGETPLHIAVSVGHPLNVAALCSNNADLDAEDERGLTPLATAAESGKYHEAFVLLGHGADCNKEDRRGWTALHIAISGNHHYCTCVLIDEGADRNCRTDDGKTPLHLAAIYKNRRAMKSLLEVPDVNRRNEKGRITTMEANLEAKDDENKTALCYAIEGGMGMSAIRRVISEGTISSVALE